MDINNASIYEGHREEMKAVMSQLRTEIRKGAKIIEKRTGMAPIEHLEGRIKDEESMREKCRRLELEETFENATTNIFDAIGLRVVCPFLDDVYSICDTIKNIPGLEIIRVKDYIKNVKPNGYRSCHIIVRYMNYYVEIQVRTISMDTWAALEHNIRYKRNISGNTALIFEELKRCADELASTDASMQTIRALINGEV